jgi:hypothetical protein
LSPNGGQAIGGTLLLHFPIAVSEVSSLFIDDQLPVTVTAFNTRSEIVGTAVSNPNLFDGWGISSPSGISRVELAGGYFAFGIPDGWGIDNLTFTPVPEPSSILLLVVAAAITFLWRVRQPRRTKGMV